MWFDTWDQLFRLLAIGPAAYVTLVLVLRLSGKRTLAKLNAFDFVVTVALGSTLASIVLSTDISWSEGALALTVLVLLQLVVTWLTGLLPGGRSIVSAQPTLLLRDGEPLLERLREQRITVDELRQAVRSTGTGTLGDVGAVVLESDGTLSVIPAQKMGDGSAMEAVDGAR